MLTLDGFRNIRSWNGSQADAFEELCYQLRDPTPDDAVLWKVGNPDRGYEWFIRHSDGSEWGWQVKYTFGIDEFLKLATETLIKVVAERPNCVRLTFCIPFDLPDVVPKRNGSRTGSSAVEKFEKWRDQRDKKVPGAERVKIILWSGGELLSRLNDPTNRGKAWFFWDHDVLSLAWCRERVDSARNAAGPRYSKELHIEMPIADAIDGLARTQRFQLSQKTLQESFNIAANKLRRILSEPTREQLMGAIGDCRIKLENFIDTGPTTAAADQLREALQQIARLLNEVVEAEKDATVRRAVNSLFDQIYEIESHLRSAMVRSASEQALLVIGDAGQGKTHLFVDAAYNLLDHEQPAVLIMGKSLSGRHALSEIARTLGIEIYGWPAMLQAMASAGEAYRRPFVLLIDGLNESDKARGWQSELTTLLSEVRRYAPWIVVALSLRTTYSDIVLGAAAADLPTVEHQGFVGIEQFATERFFAFYQLPTPQLPLVGQDMSNPLFLKLYCEVVKDGWNPSTDQQAVTVSQLFDRYVDMINRKVCETLELDEDDLLVQRAISDLAGEFTANGTDWVPRARAKQNISALAPHLQTWPHTLFGELVSEGLLSIDVTYIDDTNELKEVEAVKISYQRFADYMIAERILSTIIDDSHLANISTNDPARNATAEAQIGVIEALSVLIPERFGVELLNVTTWELDSFDQDQWHRAFLKSLPTRQRDAITPEAVCLFEQIYRQSPRLRTLASQTLVELAVHPDHRLDVDYLHSLLCQLSMPERDATWGVAMYHQMNLGALGRIIRWAAHPNHASYPCGIVEKVSIALVWMLGTPHRPMRDHITKTLARILSNRLDLLAKLYERFEQIDDPYIFERLTLITHGALIASGISNPQGARNVVEKMAAAVAARPTPDLLARDALNGSIETCIRNGTLTCSDADRLSRPTRSSITLDAPPEVEQFARYRSIGGGYEKILGSIFSLGDFGVKIIGPAVRQFSFYPIAEPYPSVPSTTAMPGHQSTALIDETPESLEQVFTHWEEFELGETDLPLPVNAVESIREHFPKDEAKAWVFQRVVELGWTSHLFDEFDATVSSRGREGHKPERFGKKYQWIALRELIARISDNYHLRRQWDSSEAIYRGAWQIRERDIDPTLPPAPLVSSTVRQTRFGATFLGDEKTLWWCPDGPRYRRTDPPIEADWAAGFDGIVELPSQLQRKASDGIDWVVLHSTHMWKDEDPLGGEDPDRPRREQWSHIYSWLVKKANTPAVYKFLSENSLMGRWMPEGQSLTTVAYLGEIPWGSSANDYPQEWLKGIGTQQVPHPVYPTWNEYCWESVVLDCSIDESVHAWMPSLDLFEAGGLTWLAGTRLWLDTAGEVAAQHLDTGDGEHSALLVRVDWLVPILAKMGWSVIFGRLGEKQLLNVTNANPGLAGDWTEINSTAVLYGSGRWKLGETRSTCRHLE